MLNLRKLIGMLTICVLAVPAQAEDWLLVTPPEGTPKLVGTYYVDTESVVQKGLLWESGSGFSVVVRSDAIQHLFEVRVDIQLVGSRSMPVPMFRTKVGETRSPWEKVLKNPAAASIVGSLRRDGVLRFGASNSI